MPEQNKRAIAGHQQEHPTEEQIEDRRNREVTERVANSIDGRDKRPLSAFEKSAAIHAILNAKPEDVFEELFRKPFLKAFDDADMRSSAKGASEK